MTISIQELEQVFRAAISLFENDAEVRKLPFIWQFPKNCCERTAALLCIALKKKYPNSDVFYIEGVNKNSSEMHYWVEIDNLVVDPTAHQFDEFSSPLLCCKPSPVESKFIRSTQTEDPLQASDLETNSRGHWHTSLEIVCRAIGA